MLSGTVRQERRISTEDKDSQPKCAQSLVQKVLVQCHSFIQMLLEGANMNDDCLKYLLCKNDIIDRDLQVMEKDGAVHISFTGTDITTNRQSLVKLTENLSKVLCIDSSKTFETYIPTSFTDNVKKTLDGSIRDCENNVSIHEKRVQEGVVTEETENDDTVTSENETEGTIGNECKDLDESPLHDSENNISTHKKKRVQEGVVTEDADNHDSIASENETGATISNKCKDLDESPSHDSEYNINIHKKKRVQEGVVIDDADNDDSFASENETGATIGNKCKDLDESPLHDIIPNTGFHKKKGVQEGVVFDDVDDDDSVASKNETGATIAKDCKDFDESPVHVSENRFDFYERKEVQEDDDSVLTLKTSEDETGANIGTKHFFELSESSGEEEFVASTSSNKKGYRDHDTSNDESGDSVVSFCGSDSEIDNGSECNSNDESEDSVVSFRDSDVDSEFDNGSGASPNEEDCTFEKFKNIVLEQHEELLNKDYEDKRSTLTKKVAVVYKDTKNVTKFIQCDSVSEANNQAFNLKDILKDPFSVVLIKETGKKSPSTICQKRAKLNFSKAGQQETPYFHGTLHIAPNAEQCEFPMLFYIDTGADSGSVGYNYNILKNSILTVCQINDSLEPAILCKVTSDTITGEVVQVFDIGQDSKWNAIGLSILKNYITYLDFKNDKLLVRKHEDVTVQETEETIQATFKKNIVSNPSLQ